MLDLHQTNSTVRATIFGVSCIVSILLQLVSHCAQKFFSFSFFLFPEHDGRPTFGPSKSFPFGLVGSFALLFLVIFKSEFLNGENVIISDRPADLPLLMVAFAFGRGNMFNGETFVTSAFSTLRSDGQIFYRLFGDVLPAAAFFSTDKCIL
jgi:hypothetical protein